jgi:hypothetical protein
VGTPVVRVVILKTFGPQSTTMPGRASIGVWCEWFCQRRACRVKDGCLDRKITTECLAQLTCRPGFCLGFRQVNYDSYGAAGGQLASPTNYKFFRFSIQIAFTERERIQCVKELRDILDSQFNQLAMRCIIHWIINNSINSLRSFSRIAD